MKITHTDIYRLSIKMEPFTIATGTMECAQNVLIKIHTDQGIYGIGECSAFPVITGETQDTCIAVGRDIAKILKGRDALDITANLLLMDTLIAGNTTIKSAFDMAFYDLAAKAKEIPLYQFLGGKVKPVETDITIGIASPTEMVEKALEYKKTGAKILKIKLGKNPKQDVERMQKIRAAVGNKMLLRIDANQGYSLDEAVYVLNEMGGLDIQFCEQPMRSWNDELLPELISKSPIKIMADESLYSHHDAERLIRNNATEYFNIKLVKSGGIGEALKIHEIAKKANIDCMLGCMLETRLALSAKLHFVYTATQVKFYDLDTCLIGQLEDPVINGMRYNGYLLEIDDLPGIGADIDESYLRKCDVWKV